MTVKYYTAVVCGRYRGDCEVLHSVVCGRCRGECEGLHCCGLWEV